MIKDEEQIQQPGASVRPGVKIVKSRIPVLDCADEVFGRDSRTTTTQIQVATPMAIVSTQMVQLFQNKYGTLR